jgi:hypothetical protein
MSISDCPECKKLLDLAATAIKEHLEALGRVSAAVHESTGLNYEALKREVNKHRVARMDAYERYQNHLCSHDARVRAAG